MSINRLFDRCMRPGERPALVDSAVAVMIATLALMTFIGVAALVPSAWRFADGDARPVLDDEMRRCEATAVPTARVACYDGIAERNLSRPAEGANAPAAAFGLAPRHATMGGPKSPGN
jgi:hypothetical protein